MECVLIFLGFVLLAAFGWLVCISVDAFRDDDRTMGAASLAIGLVFGFLSIMCFKGASDGSVFEFPVDEYNIEIKTVKVGERVDSSYVVFRK